MRPENDTVIPNYISNAESVSDMLSMFTTFITNCSFLKFNFFYLKQHLRYYIDLSLPLTFPVAIPNSLSYSHKSLFLSYVLICFAQMHTY